jgi:uncharacterized protein (DUF4415 family)
LTYLYAHGMKRASSSRKSESNLQHLKALKDSEIVADDDAPAWSPEMSARAIVKRGLDTPRTKKLLSLRVDSDVVEWFRAEGRGYESRMNALLRAYMEAHNEAWLHTPQATAGLSHALAWAAENPARATDLSTLKRRLERDEASSAKRERARDRSRSHQSRVSKR